MESANDVCPSPGDMHRTESKGRVSRAPFVSIDGVIVPFGAAPIFCARQFISDSVRESAEAQKHRNTGKTDPILWPAGQN